RCPDVASALGAIMPPSRGVVNRSCLLVIIPAPLAKVAGTSSRAGRCPTGVLQDYRLFPAAVR
ncbi:MAG: hypothetical protein ACYS7M_12080, partial [Planctomycetota bacterium]